MVNAANGEKYWLQRHTAALPKQLRLEAAAGKRAERALELARSAPYRRSLRFLMHFSPADMHDGEVIASLLGFHPHRKPLTRLPPRLRS